jgi:hypothetical protein
VSPRRCSLTLLIGLIVLSLSVPAATAETSIVVDNISGHADVETVGDAVTRVTTGADARAVLRVDTNDVTVYQNTQLHFGALLGLLTGTVRVRGALTIATANARATVSDSEITIAYDDQSGTTTIEVFDHQATVRGTSDNIEQPVAAGQMVRVGPDGISTPPHPISEDGISGARVVPSAASTKETSASRYIVAAVAAVCLLGALVVSRRSRSNVAAA